MKMSPRVKRINIICGLVFVCFNIWLYFVQKKIVENFDGYWVTQKGDEGYMFNQNGAGYEIHIADSEKTPLHWSYGGKAHFNFFYDTEPDKHYGFIFAFGQQGSDVTLELTRLPSFMGSGEMNSMILTRRGSAHMSEQNVNR